MANNLFGKFYSNTFTTGSVTGGEDLIAKVETNIGATKILVKKLTYIASGSYSIDINSSGSYSALHMNADGEYRIDLDSNDVLVNSLKVLETSASGIWLSVIY